MKRAYIAQALVILAAICGAAFILSYGARQKRISQREDLALFTQSNINDTRQAAFALERKFGDIAGELEFLSRQRAFRRRDSNKIAGEIKKAYSRITEQAACIAWVDNGRHAVIAWPRQNVACAGSTFHAAVASQGGMMPGRVLTDTFRTAGGRYMAVLREKVPSSAGGEVVALADIQALQKQIFRQWPNRQPDAVMFLDDRGRVLSHTQKKFLGVRILERPDVFSAPNAPDVTRAFMRDIRNDRAGTAWMASRGQETPLKPEGKLVAFAPVHVGDKNWAVVFVTSHGHVVSAMRYTRRENAVPVMLAALTILCAVIAVLSIHIARLRSEERAERRKQKRELAAMTERMEKEYTKQLEGATVELRRIDEMKTDLLAMVSHDMRTPLVVILGYLEMALRGQQGTLPQKLHQRLETVHKQARRLSTLIDNYLNLAVLEAGRFQIKRQRLDLNAHLHETLKSIRDDPTAHSISFIESYDPQVGTLFADPFIITQILHNLLTNAIKFTPSGGTVTISSRRVGAVTEISVSDTGIGIPVEDQSRVFERFYRANRTEGQRPGAGLGLAIAKEMVKTHGGDIALSSKPGLGTTMKFTLPAADEPASTADEIETEPRPCVPPHEMPAAPGQKPIFTMLAVDDQEDTLRYLVDIFELTENHLLIADTLEKARRQIETTPVDVILLDLIVGQESGWDFLAELRRSARTKNVPVIIHSAIPESVAWKKAQALGANRYLTKPAGAEEIMRAVESALCIT